MHPSADAAGLMLPVERLVAGVSCADPYYRADRAGAALIFTRRFSKSKAAIRQAKVNRRPPIGFTSAIPAWGQLHQNLKSAPWDIVLLYAGISNVTLEADA